MPPSASSSPLRVRDAAPRARVRLEPGTALDRYLVADFVGAGAMGAVYRAYDPELDRRVAIKLLHIQDDEDHCAAIAHARDQLLREAQALAKLDHPNVVRVFDVGRVPAGVFVIMEFVEGQTLHNWLQTPHDLEEIIEVFHDAGCGLAAAHNAGLVHRDFKPANVVVGDDGRVRVLDFGLARSAHDAETVRKTQPLPSAAETTTAEDEASEEDAVRASQAALGTPAYMAPEQYLGGKVMPATDQFSFVSALYEAIYGELPFGSAREGLQARVVAGDIQPAPRSTRVPPWLRQVLVRALARRPEERYPSMEALLAALSHDPRARRQRLLRSAVALMGIAAVAGLIGTLWPEPPDCRWSEEEIEALWPADDRQRFVSAFQKSGISFAPDTAQRVMERMNAYANTVRAAYSRACRETLVDHTVSAEVYALRHRCLVDSFESLERLTQAMSTQPDLEMVSQAATAVGKLPTVDRCHDIEALQAPVNAPSDPEVAAATQEVERELKNASTLLWLGQYRAAEALALELQQRSAAWHHAPTDATVGFVLAQAQNGRGSHHDSRLTAQQALFDAATARDHALVAEVAFWFFETARDPQQLDGWQTDLRRVASRLGRPVESQGSYQAAMAHYAEVHGDLLTAELRRRRALELFKEEKASPERINATLFDLGETLWRLNRFDEAESVLRALLAEGLAKRGAEHPVVADYRNDLGIVLHQQGAFGAAEDEHRRALATRLKVFGPDHPTVSLSHNNLGMLMVSRGAYVEAETHLRDSLSIAHDTYGPDHTDTAHRHNNLALALMEQGQLDEALEHAEVSVSHAETHLGDRHILTVLYRSNAATLWARKGQGAAAEKLARKALEGVQSILGPEHGHTARVRGALGEALFVQGRWREAQREYEEAHRVAAAVFSDRDRHLAEIRVGWTATLIRLGGYREAQRHLDAMARLDLPPERNDVRRAEALRRHLLQVEAQSL